MFLSLPASVALFIGSDVIISALFGYGSFTEEAVDNSAQALFYFWSGFTSVCFDKSFFRLFFSSNHDTKTPFYISLFSVILNVIISIYYFKSVGFIIIPIATSISSWFNSIILFIFLKNREFVSI